MGGILSDEKNAKMMAEYDKWIATADPALAPQPPIFDAKEDIKSRQKRYAAFQEDLAKFQSNPGFKIIDDAQKKVLTYFPGKTLEDENVKAAIVTELAEKKRLFEAGLNEGVTDRTHFNNAMSALTATFPPNIFTVVKELFLSFPIVGDAMAAGGKMIMSLFSGKPIGPMTAFENIKMERALGGGLSKLGIADKQTVDAISSRVIAGGFAGIPEKVEGKIYSPRAGEMLAEMKILRESKKFDSELDAPGAAVLTINGADGKPVTVLGTSIDNVFTVSKVIKFSDDGKTSTEIDAKDEQGRSMVGRQLAIANGSLNEINKDQLIKSTGRVTVSAKVYDTKAPEVLALLPEINTITPVQENKNIVVINDSNGKPGAILVGTKTETGFKVEAIMKKTANGKAFAEADVKKQDGTLIKGSTLPLTDGSLDQAAIIEIAAGVNALNAAEPKPDVVYGASSKETKPILTMLSEEKSDLFNQVINGKKLMVLGDIDNKQVIVVGSSVDGNKFTPESVLKVVEGTLTEVNSDVKNKALEMDPISGKLKQEAFRALEASIDKKYSKDGKEVVVISDNLKKSVTDYATLRFTNLETGAVDQAKVDVFVNRYNDMVVNAGMPTADQNIRANQINLRTNAAKARLTDAATAAEIAEAPSASASDNKFESMRGAIDQALRIMAGTEKLDNKPLDESLAAAMPEGELLVPASTPKATAAGLLKAAAPSK